MAAPSASAFLDEPTPPKASDFLDAPSQSVPASQPPVASDFLDQPGTQERAQQIFSSGADPAIHAASNPADFEAAFQAQKLRDNRSIGEKAGAIAKTALTPSTWGNAAVGVGKFGLGLATAPLNALGQFWHGGLAAAGSAVGASDFSTSEAQKALRDRAEAVLAGQNVEESLKSAGRAVMALRPNTGAGDISGSMEAPMQSEDPADQAKSDAAANDAHARQEFSAKVQAAKNSAQLAQMRPLEGGVVSALTGATGYPVSELTPEQLSAAGTPAARPLMVESEAAAANPENLAIAAAPELPGAAYLGGRATQLAGKALQIPGKGISALGSGIRSVMHSANDVVPHSGYAIPHAVGLYGIYRSPEALAAAAATVGASKGLQWLGKGLEEQGGAAASGAPSALDTAAANARLNGTGSALVDTQRVIGDAASRAAATAIGMAPLNAALSGGDAEDFARQEVGAAAFGGATDMLRSARPTLVEAARPALRQKGLEAMDTNTREGRQSAQFIQGLPDAQKNTVLELQGALAGLPTATPSGETVPSRMIVQNDTDYQATVKRLAGPNAPTDGGQGFFWGPDGTAYINGEHSQLQDPQNFAQLAGHEFAGHAAANMLLAAGSKGGPIYDGLIRSAKSALYNPDGTPTPDFQRFVDTYNRSFDPTGQHKQIDPANQNSIDEFLAETAGKIISRHGAADIALPPSLLDRVTQGIGTFFSGLSGVDPRSVGNGRFGQKEVADLSQTVRDSLYQLAGMKLRPGQGEGAISRPQSPDEYVQELQDTLAKPRPTDTAANVKAWVKEQSQARKDLADFQGPQSGFPAAGKAPTPPSAPAAPVNPARADAIKAMVTMGIKPVEAAQHVDAAAAALGGTPNASDLLTAAIKSRSAGRAQPPQPAIPNVQPVSAQAPQPIPQGAVVATAGDQPAPAAPAPVPNETTAPVAVGPKPVADPPEKVAADAEQAAIAKEKNQRANTAAGQKRVQDAKVEALAEAGKQSPDDLHVVTDSLGAKTLVGNIDPSNPYHAAILKELGISPDQIKGVTDAQALNGTPAYIRYRSAKSDTEGAGGEGSAESIADAQKRAVEIEANPAQDRKQWTIQHKVAIPLDTSLTKEGGVSKRFLVLSDLLHNAQSIFEWMKANGEANPYGATPAEQEQGLSADAQAYAKNHANGWKGDGSAPAKGFPDSGLAPLSPDYQPTVIPKDRFDVLNAMFNNEKAVKVGEKQTAVDDKLQRVSDAKTPGAKKTAQGVYARALKALRESEELQALNKENGAYLDPNSNETNELRARMKASGFDPSKNFYSIFQNLSPDHILGVSDKPISIQPGDVPSIRPSGFDIDPAELAREGLPNQKAVAAGFSPSYETDKLTPERLMVNIRNYGANRTSGGTPKDYRGAASTFLGGGQRAGGQEQSVRPDDSGAAGRNAAGILNQGAQQKALIQWAQENGAAIPERPESLDPSRKDNKGEGEHDVFFDTPSQRWIKTTKPGNFGVYPALRDGKLTLRPATPAEYLARLNGTEKMFDVKTPVHGFIVDPEDAWHRSPSIVTSQDNMQGMDLKEGQIEDILKKEGFLKVDDALSAYYRKSDNTVIADAHPGNVKLIGAGPGKVERTVSNDGSSEFTIKPDIESGKLAGYDAIVMEPDGALKTFFENAHDKAATRTKPPKYSGKMPSFAEAMQDSPEAQASGFSPSEDTGAPEEGANAGERLAREAEAAGIPLRVDDFKGLMGMEPVTVARIRARIEQKTGNPARFSPPSDTSPASQKGRVVPLASILAQQRQRERDAAK